MRRASFKSTNVDITLVGLALALALALAPAPAGAQGPPEVRWSEYTLEVGDSAVAAELGRLTVPAVRASGSVDRGAGEVELAFVRLPSRAAEPGPPIVYLDGGPGGSGYGIAEVPAYFRLFDALRDVGDVILLSQRGTGLSRPGLACGLESAVPADLFTTRERILEVLRPEVELCAARRRAEGIDLSAFNTRESADDVESLRRALGAGQLSLLGFSYGTHLGLTVLRRHGRRIQRAVLIGTEGPDHTYKLPSTADLQLRHLSARIAADPAVRDVMPNLYGAIDTLLRRLDAEPLALEVRTRAGERTILLGGDGMRYLIRRDLGDTFDHPVWPVAFRRTLDGDLALIRRLAERRFNELGGVPLMSMLMDCASGVTDGRARQIRAEAPGSILRGMTNLWYPDVCDALPEARLDAAYRAPFTSDVPTLFLSGTLDANTPPYQAWEVSWGWPNATHIVVDGAGHEAIMPWSLARPVIVDFFRGGDVPERRLPAYPLEFLTPGEVAEMMGG